MLEFLIVNLIILNKEKIFEGINVEVASLWRNPDV